MELETVVRMLGVLADPSSPEETRPTAVDLLWLGCEEVPPDLLVDVAMVLAVERPFTPPHPASRAATPT